MDIERWTCVISVLLAFSGLREMRPVRGRKLIGFPTFCDERDSAGLPPDKVLDADTDVGTIWVDKDELPLEHQL
jgi:hypothetical protein